MVEPETYIAKYTVCCHTSAGCKKSLQLQSLVMAVMSSEAHALLVTETEN